MVIGDGSGAVSAAVRTSGRAAVRISVFLMALAMASVSAGGAAARIPPVIVSPVFSVAVHTMVSVITIVPIAAVSI